MVNACRGGSVQGDAGIKMDNSVGGDDYVYVNSVYGGYVGGDSKEMHNSTAGADAIRVDCFSYGVVAGDGAIYSGVNKAASSGNIITIHQFSTSSARSAVVDGGLGDKDILSFGAGNDVINLAGSATGKITFSTGAGDHGNLGSGVAIRNVEVFDGGTGSDVLNAASVSGNIVLRGGAGSDTLTGSRGSTIYQWDARDITSGAVDTVTNFKAGDKILLGDGISASLSYDSNVAYLDLSANGMSQQVVVKGLNLGAVCGAGGLNVVGGGLSSVCGSDAALNASISNSLSMAEALDCQVAVFTC